MGKNKYWFKPKRIGWGIAYPISWEGWLMLILLVILVYRISGLNNLNSTNGLILFLGEVIIILCLFMYIVRNKVKDGLKWRSIKDLEKKGKEK